MGGVASANLGGEAHGAPDGCSAPSLSTTLLLGQSAVTGSHGRDWQSTTKVVDNDGEAHGAHNGNVAYV